MSHTHSHSLTRTICRFLTHSPKRFNKIALTRTLANIHSIPLTISHLSAYGFHSLSLSFARTHALTHSHTPRSPRLALYCSLTWCFFKHIFHFTVKNLLNTSLYPVVARTNTFLKTKYFFVQWVTGYGVNCENRTHDLPVMRQWCWRFATKNRCIKCSLYVYTTISMIKCLPIDTRWYRCNKYSYLTKRLSWWCALQSNESIHLFMKVLCQCQMHNCVMVKWSEH